MRRATARATVGSIRRAIGEPRWGPPSDLAPLTLDDQPVVEQADGRGQSHQQHDRQTCHLVGPGQLALGAAPPFRLPSRAGFGLGLALSPAALIGPLLTLGLLLGTGLLRQA